MTSSFFGFSPTSLNFFDDFAWMIVPKFEIAIPKLPNFLTFLKLKSKNPRCILAGEFIVY